MKTINWIVLLTGITFLAGCASTPPDTPITTGQTSTPQTVILDSDGDGIPDADDVCTDSSARIMVDATGCELVMGVIEGLGFGSNEVLLNDEARAVLDGYIEALNRYPDVIVQVEAHTDNRGPALGNRELSKERVLSVVRYMVSNGISPNRLKPYGYGESRPRAANATAEGREQNRRIEIKTVEGLL